LTCQKWMLENVVEDMRQGGIDHIVIPGKTFEGQPGQAVWRKPSPGCAMDDESDSE